MESRGAQDGERKTITALFADIKGSVEMMEGLDPEEARAIVDPARSFFGITEQDSDQAAREKIAGRYVLLDESLREAPP
jgi:hypothetical protein